MRKSIFVVLFVLVVSMLLISACTTQATTQPAVPTTGSNDSGSSQESNTPTTQPANSGSSLDGKTLVEERCTACHSIARVEKPHTADEWKSIVERMINDGAQLNAEEKDVVIQYLSTTYAK